MGYLPSTKGVVDMGIVTSHMGVTYMGYITEILSSVSVIIAIQRHGYLSYISKKGSPTF